MVAGFKGSAYVKVPLLVDKDDGLLENGGAWIFYLKDKMYVGKRFVSVDESSDDLRTPAQSKKSPTQKSESSRCAPWDLLADCGTIQSKAKMPWHKLASS